MATKPTDKEYDRYKGLGAPYARPYSTKDFSMNFLNIFRKHVRPCFTPNQMNSVPVGGLTINLILSSGLHYLTFSSRLEASQPEMNCRSYSLSQATEKTLTLDNASKINVSSNILSSTFQNSFFQSETSNFPLSSNTS